MSPITHLHHGLHTPLLASLTGTWWGKTLLGLTAFVVLAIAIINGLRFYYRRLHHLRHLPGGAPDHWLLGDYGLMMNFPTGEYAANKIKRYGHTYRGHQILGEPMVVTTDPVAIAFVQNHNDAFIKPPPETDVLLRFIGRGLVNSEGADHRRQRKVINPAFSPAAIRDMVPMFYQKGYQLLERLSSHISLVDSESDVKGGGEKRPGARAVDMTLFLNQVTFDVIGLAGFDVDFECLTRGHAVVDAYRTALAEVMRMSPLGILQSFMPDVFNIIPSKRNRLLEISNQTTQAFARKVVARKKREVMALQGGDSVEKDTNVGKDLLSLIVKANMAANLPANQRLTDQEIVYQVSTFLLAGSETSSNGIGWCLYRLATNPQYQTRLREELRQVDEDEPSLDKLNSLPFLDNVLHEALRLDPPVPETVRMTTQDIVLPLSSPIIGDDGSTISEIPIKKGVLVIPAFFNNQRDPATWGEDADIFNPDRFDRPGIPTRHVPGVWGNLTTFNGGARACIGYRFALAEMKAILFVLIRNFIFEMPPGKVVTSKNFIVMTPWIQGEEDLGSQLPLLVRPVASE